MHADSVSQIREEYDGAIASAEQRITALHLQAEVLRTEEQHAARRQLLVVEKDALLAARRKGYLSQEAHEELLADVNERLFALDSQ